MNISRRILLLAIIGPGLVDPVPESGQDVAPPVLRAGSAPDTLRIDGLLLEPAWAATDATDTFTQTDPAEGALPTRRTTVRVLADPRVPVIGVMCEDDPHSIVSFSVSRDAGMQTTANGSSRATNETCGGPLPAAQRDRSFAINAVA